MSSNNQLIKRGIAVIPTIFGISFGFNAMDQGGALLHIYKDGSVLISHGGVEIGQASCDIQCTSVKDISY